ncbi:MAG: hypothetical protein JWM57_3219 [Phycisphaerales bacterium]|nr:hypothetical protein [Phycisphaerales bacterium]
MHRALVLGIVTVSSVAFAGEPAAVPPRVPNPLDLVVPPANDGRPLVQVAILLDTSNSMDGLINQARTQLWTIVNEISKAKRAGQTPRLEVALYEYGNNNLAAGEGYIRMVTPFTSNLDDVSEKLFALSTNGGEEYCGAVIESATKSLKWSSDPAVYKGIFIAGNEPFSQGQTDYHSSIREAVGKGVVVNTIHCGPATVGTETGWAEGAKIGQGAFTNINQDIVRNIPRCPQDDRISTLSTEMNTTYLPFGTRGRAAAENQVTQDANAAKNAPSGAVAQRAASKAGQNYVNAEWDAVDAAAAGKLDLKTAKDTELPEKLQNKSPEERKAIVADMAKRREAIRDELNKLVAEREKLIAAAQREGDPTLDAAVIGSIRAQLGQQKYEFEGK